MDTENFINNVEKIDWDSYKYNYYHNTQIISKSLTELALIDKEEINNGKILLNSAVYNSVLSAIGNNHAGTYYPVAQVALEFIIQVALYGNNEISRNCAINILLELFFFMPENDSSELEKFVKKTIAEQKDNFLKLSCINDINSDLLVDFVDCITEYESEIVV